MDDQSAFDVPWRSALPEFLGITRHDNCNFIDNSIARATDIYKDVKKREKMDWGSYESPVRLEPEGLARPSIENGRRRSRRTVRRHVSSYDSPAVRHRLRTLFTVVSEPSEGVSRSIIAYRPPARVLTIPFLGRTAQIWPEMDNNARHNTVRPRWANGPSAFNLAERPSNVIFFSLVQNTFRLSRIWHQRMSRAILGTSSRDRSLLCVRPVKRSRVVLFWSFLCAKR